MPRKVRQLVVDLTAAGWYLQRKAGKGSHRKFKHPRVRRSIILSGGDNQDAERYQEKDVRDGVKDAQDQTQANDEAR